MNDKTPTLTQSEELKIGQRGEYKLKPQGATAERAAKLGITAWVEKRKSAPSEADKALRQFIDIGIGYKLVYGITYKGNDFDCGDMPRDLGHVIRGIAIASGLPVS